MDGFEDKEFEYESGRKYVSDSVISRLPRYFRYLRMLLESGRTRINSTELSSLMHLTASQIRQDLNCFGGFGKQGVGYDIRYLHTCISAILGADRQYTAVIIGAGDLGRALARSRMFSGRGITVLSLFDVNRQLIGQETADILIRDMDELVPFCCANKVDIAVLTVPKESFEDAVRRIGEAGIKGVWNFTSMELDPEQQGFVIENVHLGDSLQRLTYHLRVAQDKEKEN
ncbi:MAG: redox-sensing transcriptional repressor Rex [Clostridia bacterium]|nr:redox-sensing transcriptional repressor Rex [Clostridia bacterium]